LVVFSGHYCRRTKSHKSKAVKLVARLTKCEFFLRPTSIQHSFINLQAPMDLTPIRVSGKNRRDNSKKAIAKRKALVSSMKRSTKSANPVQQRRTPGRPLKEPTSNAVLQISASSTPSSKKAKKRTLENIKSKRKMSLLEKLPTEILEAVFLYCLNLELPRASPVIAGKLSSEIIYLHAILSAFDPTWGKWHGREKILKTKRYNEEDSVDTAFEGDPKFQVRQNSLMI
jgi:hypothetical protein